ADLINSVGATWQYSSNVVIADDAGTFFSRFFNDGTLNKSGPGTTTKLQEIEFNNAGTVNVPSGILSLAGGGSTNGTFTISSVGELRFEGALQHFLAAASRITGPVGSRLIFADGA